MGLGLWVFGAWGSLVRAGFAIGLALWASSAAAQPYLVGVEYDTGKLWFINPTDGSLNELGNSGITGIGSLEAHTDGFLYGFTTGTSAALYKFDLDDIEHPTRVGPLNAGYVFEGALVRKPGGPVYGTNAGDAERPKLFTVDLATGGATLGPQLGLLPHDFNGLAFRDDGALVGIDREDNSLYEIDRASGALSLIKTWDRTADFTIGAVGGMSVLDGTTFFTTSGKSGSFPGSNMLYSLNTHTGVATRIGDAAIWDATIRGIGISGLATVPEPATLSTALLALAWFAGRSARRRRG